MLPLVDARSWSRCLTQREQVPHLCCLLSTSATAPLPDPGLGEYTTSAASRRRRLLVPLPDPFLSEYATSAASRQRPLLVPLPDPGLSEYTTFC